ncbi:MAG: PKD domain-containing protein [Bacteroidota bacterium]
MKTIAIIISLCLYVVFANAQCSTTCNELVPNGSFELVDPDYVAHCGVIPQMSLTPIPPLVYDCTSTGPYWIMNCWQMGVGEPWLNLLGCGCSIMTNVHPLSNTSNQRSLIVTSIGGGGNLSSIGPQVLLSDIIQPYTDYTISFWARSDYLVNMTDTVPESNPKSAIEFGLSDGAIMPYLSGYIFLDSTPVAEPGGWLSFHDAMIPITFNDLSGTPRSYFEIKTDQTDDLWRFYTQTFNVGAGGGMSLNNFIMLNGDHILYPNEDMTRLWRGRITVDEIRIKPTNVSCSFTPPAQLGTCYGPIDLSQYLSVPGGTFNIDPAYVPALPATSPLIGSIFHPSNAAITPLPALVTFSYTYSISGCTDTTYAQILIISGANPILSSSSTSPICYGQSVILTATSTDTNVRYVWDPNIGTGAVACSTCSTTFAIPTSATNYHVICIDTLTNCSATMTNSVNINPVPHIDVYSTDPTTCTDTNGTITVHTTSPNTPNTSYILHYTYLGIGHDSMVTTDSYGDIILDSLSSVTYINIYITDNNGCSSSQYSVSLSFPLAPSFGYIASTNPSTCLGTNGSIKLWSFSTSPFTYKVKYQLNGVWDSVIALLASGVPIALTLTGLSEGSYSNVTVTNENTNCTSAPWPTPIVLSDPTAPTISSTTVTNPTSCGGTGHVTIHGTMPNSPYSVFYKKDGVWHTITTLYSSGSQIDISTFTSGVYDSFYIVSLNCYSDTLSSPFNLNDPIPPHISGDSSYAPTTCNGTDGSIILYGLSNSTPYQLLYRKNGTTIGPLSITTTYTGSYTINGLGFGIFDSIRVIATNSCISNSVGPDTLSDPPTPSLTISSTNNPVNCNDTGSIELLVDIPNVNYLVSYNLNYITYPISIPAIGDIIHIPNLYAGVYSDIFVTVVSTNCTSTSVGPDALNDPIAPYISDTSHYNTASCGSADGSIILYGLTADSPYAVHYIINNTSTVDTILFANSSGNIIIANLGVGLYDDINVKTHHCLSNTVGPISILNADLPIIYFVTTHNPDSCGVNNGSITLHTNFHDSTFQVIYVENGGTPNTVILTSNADSLITISGLGPDTFSNIHIIIHGCNFYFMGTFILSAPAAPVISNPFYINPTACGSSNGYIGLHIDQAYAPFTVYYTQLGVGDTSLLLNASADSLLTIYGLGPGIYDSFYVTNILNCHSDTLFIDIHLLPPPNPLDSVEQDTTYICVGDTLSVNAMPDPSLTFHWDGPGGFSSDSIFATAYPATEAMSGVYTLTITDPLTGCVSYDSAYVLVNPLPSVSVSAYPTSILSGSFTTFSATGADTYVWTPTISCSSLPCSTGIAYVDTSTTFIVTGYTNGCPNTNTVSITTTHTTRSCVGGINTYSFHVPVGYIYTFSVNSIGSIVGSSDSSVSIQWLLMDTGIIAIHETSGGTTTIIHDTVIVYPVSQPNITADVQVACVPQGYNSDPPALSDTACIFVCPGSTVTYTATGDSFDAFGWSVVGASSYYASGNTCTVTWQNYSIGGSGAIMLYDTTLGGCVVTSIKCVQFLQPPLDSFGVQLNGLVFDSIEVCDSTLVSFIDFSVPPFGSSINSWQWDFGDGHSASTGGSANHQYNTPGTYTATLTVTSVCGCIATRQMLVKVDDSNGVKIHCPSVVCELDTVTYSVDVSCSSYGWSVVGGIILETPPFSSIIHVVWNSVDSFSGFGYVIFDASSCSVYCPDISAVRVPVIMRHDTITGPFSICEYGEGLYNLPMWPTTVFNWYLDTTGTGVSATIERTDQRNQILVKVTSAPLGGTIFLKANYINTLLGCGGATDSIPIKITVPDTIIGPSKVCLNTSDTFNLLNGSTPLIWLLTSPDGTSDTLFNATPYTHTFDQIGLYSLWVFDTSYCLPTPFVIRVDSLPASPSSISGPAIMCKGVPVTYTAGSIVTNSLFAWTVTNGIANQIYGTSNIITFDNDMGPFSIKVIRVDGMAPFCISDTFTLTVDTLTVIAQVTGTDTICPASTYAYSSTYLNGETYHWSVVPTTAGSVSSGDGTAHSHILWNNSGTSYQTAKVVVQIHKCMNDYFDTMTVHIKSMPNGSLFIKDTVCTGAVCIDSTTPYPGVSFIWSFGDGHIVFDNHYIQRHTYSLNDSNAVTLTATVQIIGANGCPDTIIASHNTYVLPAPIAYVTPPSPITFCTSYDTANVLYATLLSGYTTGTHFQWYRDSIALTDTTNMYIVTQPNVGNYYVVATGSSGCWDTSNHIYADSCTTAYGSGSTNDSICHFYPTYSNVYESCGKIFAEFRFGRPLFWHAWENYLSPMTAITTDTTAVFYPNVAGLYNIRYYATAKIPLGSIDTCRFDSITMHVLVPYIARVNHAISCSSTPGFYHVTVYDNSSYYPTTPINNRTFMVDSSYIYSNSNAIFDTLLAPGMHYFSITIGNTSLGTECSATDSILLPELPNATFTRYRDSTCVNLVAVHFTATYMAGMSYLWDFGDGPTNSAINPSKVYSSINDFPVILTVTNGLGCSDYTNQSVQVVGNSLHGQIDVSASTECSGVPITLTYDNLATSGFGYFPDSFYWMQGIDTFTINSTGTEDVSLSGAYWVNVTNNFGCWFSTPVHAVNFYPSPTPVILGGHVHCANILFSLSGYEGIANISYLWLRDGTAIDTIAEITQSLPVGTYNYRLVISVTNPGGVCTDTSAIFTVIIPTVPPTPSLTYTITDCNPYEVELDASNTIAGIYNWSNGMSGDTVTVTLGGDYVLTFTDSEGCTSHAYIQVPKELSNYLWEFPKGCYTFCAGCLPRTIVGPFTAEFDKWEWMHGGSAVVSGYSSVTNYNITSSGVYNLYLQEGPCNITSDPMDISVNSCAICDKLDFSFKSWIKDTVDGGCIDSIIISIGNPYTTGYSYTVTSKKAMLEPYSGWIPSGHSFDTLRYIVDIGLSGTDTLTFVLTDNGGKKCIKQFIDTLTSPCDNNYASKHGTNDTGIAKGDITSVVNVGVARLQLIPNPARNTTQVSYEYIGTGQNRYIEVYDLLGRLMDKQIVNDIRGNWQLNLDRYAAGMYIVFMKQDGQVLLENKLSITH